MIPVSEEWRYSNASAVLTAIFTRKSSGKSLWTSRTSERLPLAAYSYTKIGVSASKQQPKSLMMFLWTI
uniref:Uncharacterized protein n=1 Tax=Arundo donax TaxID=35708 RepID=A0A0A8Z852_ARUDO